ncbi:MAG TPA: guanylate kinase [Dictyoglomaceae bacterium]|nr:guanylate kinase [Dictyoglomaceae bacterium]HOL39092.1 guanylate kinase [Dictyoglomaceae bacterium]HOP94299.1 guanylate kinase [Dictyoglomaceae bacterium]HPP15246.1 guanylate kinase [Dictyoglomaceae bacterium]HPU42652.1 guanylate kinase [Dictyoglomaceae bacterium]
MNFRGNLIVLSGPSGVGKDAILEGILKIVPRLVKSVSFTTRPKRPGEKEGKSYFFTDEETFKEMIKQGKFLEWACVHGYLYGTPKKFVEERLAAGYDVILKIDVQGGVNVKKICEDAKLIFILPPSFNELKRRLMDRNTESEKDLATRLKDVPLEISRISYYDYAVINENLNEAVDLVRCIILAERHRLYKEKVEYYIKNLGGEVDERNDY